MHKHQVLHQAAGADDFLLLPWLRKSVPPYAPVQNSMKPALGGLHNKLILAERVGFEPTWRVTAHPISSRRRYGHFGTSP